MRIILAFDSNLICCFEKFGHSFQKLTGKNNLWLGWFIFWSNLLYKLYTLYIGKTKENVTQSAIAISLTVFTFGMWQFIVNVTIHEWVSGIRRGIFTTRNPLENSPTARVIRLAMFFILGCDLLLTITTNDSWHSTISDLVSIMMWYIISCTPLPPGKSTLSKLATRLGKSPLAHRTT
jgi:hypothetical protein